MIMIDKKEIFLIPYAHLDTQWRWEYPTTIKKYIKNTLEENLYLFEKYPEYQFNFTGAIRYSMMKEYYPDKFEKVKKYVNEGRWHVIGTCLDETDALIPCVESMMRNVLYGDRWAKKEFGKSSRDYVIPDCFGFPANMPSVLAHCGIHGFSTQKLGWKSAVGIPFEIGIWKGPDGSVIVCALNPCSYNSKLSPPVYKDSDRLERLNILGEKNGIWKSYQYYGVGDIGGAPTEASVKRAIQSISYAEENNPGYVVRQGSSDEFFNEITEQEKKQMDRYAGDLLLINHSAGTLTSAAIMKRWNRKNEELAFAAELAAVTATWITGSSYPNHKIKSAWYKIIGSQFHDILPGTSTPIAYQYSQNDEVVALNIWNSILEDAATEIAPFVKGEGDILLFNPLGEYRTDAVDIILPEWDKSKGINAEIFDAEGKSFPVQLRRNENGTFQATFIPKLRPFSWSRFSLKSMDSVRDSQLNNAVNVSRHDFGFVLENSCYRVKISKEGSIESIFHKSLKKELLSRPLVYEFQKERPYNYPAWNMYWKDRKREPFLRLEHGEKVSIIEEGPLRSTIRITTTYKSSILLKDISLSRDSKIVEFTERIHWRKKGCSLKFALNANMNTPKITYNWETSRMERGLNHKKQFEMPSRLWVDMSEDNWGVSIIEDSKYGYDHPHENTLRMTLLYTPAIYYFAGYWDQKYQDWGDHTIRYAIYGHEGNFEGIDHFAKRFNQKVRSFRIKDDLTSEVKDEVSLFEVSSEQLGILAVKKPEDRKGILIRLYERYGKSVNAEIMFNSEIHSVKEVNGLEEIQGEVKFSGKKFDIKMKANGIRSYIVELKNDKNPIPVKQESLNLAYNSKLIGSREDTQVIFPAKITPEKLSSGSVSYHLAVDEKLNTLQCRGQEISIPEGYNTLSILIGSKKECKTTFSWLDGKGKQLKKEIFQNPEMTKFLGQWDTRIWRIKPRYHLKNKRNYAWLNLCKGIIPGYVNRNRLEWFASHTYKNGKVQPYHYGYLFTINLKIPENARSILLPEDPRIYIIAMTVSQQRIKVQTNQYLQDKFDF